MPGSLSLQKIKKVPSQHLIMIVVSFNHLLIMTRLSCYNQYEKYFYRAISCFLPNYGIFQYNSERTCNLLLNVYWVNNLSLTQINITFWYEFSIRNNGNIFLVFFKDRTEIEKQQVKIIDSLIKLKFAYLDMLTNRLFWQLSFLLHTNCLKKAQWLVVSNLIAFLDNVMHSN